VREFQEFQMFTTTDARERVDKRRRFIADAFRNYVQSNDRQVLETGQANRPVFVVILEAVGIGEWDFQTRLRHPMYSR
jgi:hypothetical protein